MAKEIFLEDLDMSFPHAAIDAYRRLSLIQEQRQQPSVVQEYWKERANQREIEKEKLESGFYVGFCYELKVILGIDVTPETVSNLFISGMTLAEISQMYTEAAKLNAIKKTNKDEHELEKTKYNDALELHSNEQKRERAKRHLEIRALPFDGQYAAWTREDIIIYEDGRYKIFKENALVFVKSAKTKEQIILMLEWFVAIVNVDNPTHDYKELRDLVLQSLSDQDAKKFSGVQAYLLDLRHE